MTTVSGAELQPAEFQAETGANGLQMIVRFLRIIRLRKGVLAVCLVVAGVLGLLYFVTAPRYYDSKADPGAAEVNVAKHRGGPTGIVKLTWADRYCLFQDATL